MSVYKYWTVQYDTNIIHQHSSSSIQWFHFHYASTFRHQFKVIFITSDIPVTLINLLQQLYIFVFSTIVCYITNPITQTENEVIRGLFFLMINKTCSKTLYSTVPNFNNLCPQDCRNLDIATFHFIIIYIFSSALHLQGLSIIIICI